MDLHHFIVNETNFLATKVNRDFINLARKCVAAKFNFPVLNDMLNYANII